MQTSFKQPIDVKVTEPIKIDGEIQAQITNQPIKVWADTTFEVAVQGTVEAEVTNTVDVSLPTLIEAAVLETAASTAATTTAIATLAATVASEAAALDAEIAATGAATVAAVAAVGTLIGDLKTENHTDLTNLGGNVAAVGSTIDHYGTMAHTDIVTLNDNVTTSQKKPYMVWRPNLGFMVQFDTADNLAKNVAGGDGLFIGECSVGVMMDLENNHAQADTHVVPLTIDPSGKPSLHWPGLARAPQYENYVPYNYGTFPVRSTSAVYPPPRRSLSCFGRSTRHC